MKKYTEYAKTFGANDEVLSLLNDIKNTAGENEAISTLSEINSRYMEGE